MADAYQLSNEASSLIAQGKYKQGMVNLVPALRLARQLGAAAARSTSAHAVSSGANHAPAATADVTASSNHLSTIQLVFSSPDDDTCNTTGTGTRQDRSPPFLSSTSCTCSAASSASHGSTSPSFLGDIFQLPLFVQMKTTIASTEDHHHATTVESVRVVPAPLTVRADLGSSQEPNTSINASSPTAEDASMITLTIIYNLALSMHLQALRGNDGETITPIDRSLGPKALALYQHAHALLFQGMLSTKWNETETRTVLSLGLMVNMASISRTMGKEEDAMGFYHRAFSMLLWAERHHSSNDQQHTHDCNHMKDMYKSYLDLFYSHLIGKLAGGGCCAACA